MTLIKKAKEIRDQIVQAYNIVNNFNLNSVNDYKKLSLKLEDQIGHRYNQNWLRKYFYLMFPNKFFPAYSSKILNHFYYSLGFYPTGNDYEKNGFLSLVLNKSLVPIINQGELLFSLFSGNKTFINIDISDFSEVFLEQLIKNNKIVLNNKLKLNFSKFLTKRFRESHLKSFLQNNLSNLSSQELSSLYQTVNSFLEVGEDSIIFITKNKKPFALIDNLNNYSYQENDEYPHSLSGNWYFPFDKSEDIDISREKPRSLPYIVNSENLLSLYQI